MTDKPDVAAHTRYLRSRKLVVIDDLQRMKEPTPSELAAADELDRLASELTRLAAEHSRLVDKGFDLIAERDEAKAEIARLRGLMQDWIGNQWETRFEVDDALRAALKPDTGEKPWDDDGGTSSGNMRGRG